MNSNDIFKRLLCSERVHIQLATDKEAQNLHKNLSKKWKKFEADMEAAHYKALPAGDFAPYSDGGLSGQTVGYERGKSHGIFDFFIREKKANQIATAKTYQIINQTNEPV
jgi:hypothetical protein